MVSAIRSSHSETYLYLANFLTHFIARSPFDSFQWTSPRPIRDPIDTREMLSDFFMSTTLVSELNFLMLWLGLFPFLMVWIDGVIFLR